MAVRIHVLLTKRVERETIVVQEDHIK